jgi:chaperonin cofactor prefoldin
MCELCNFSSKLKTDLNRHLNSKKHFNNTYISLSSMVMSTNEHKKSSNEHKKSTNEHTFKCDLCDLYFSTKPNKRRHEIHYCKEVASKDTKIKTLEKEKKKLEKKIEKMMNNVCTINNTTNNTQNIIVVNNYGKENIEYLTVDKIKKLLDRPYDSIQELIKMLHFDTNHPENHNVKITNKKEPYALVWNDHIWELRQKKKCSKGLS